MAKKLNIADLQPPHFMEPVSHQDTHYIHCRVLIVCEGEQTEPNYFASFSMMKNASNLVYEVTNAGGRISTIQVVTKAMELRDKAIRNGNPYDAVWAVFDKDNFPDADFDSAIAKARTNNIGCAWSNEAFELWYVYHFDNRITPMSRRDYQNTITKRICAAGKKGFKYKKNDPDMRKILAECGGNEKQAIIFSAKQEEAFPDTKYHAHNPCTTVYQLVRLLRGEDKNFNKAVAKDLNKK